jgi:hypothetical protein
MRIAALLLLASWLAACESLPPSGVVLATDCPALERGGAFRGFDMAEHCSRVKARHD